MKQSLALPAGCSIFLVGSNLFLTFAKVVCGSPPLLHARGVRRQEKRSERPNGGGGRPQLQKEESRQLTRTAQSFPVSEGPRKNVQAMFHSGESDHPQFLLLRLNERVWDWAERDGF